MVGKCIVSKSFLNELELNCWYTNIALVSI